jgi:hypothetical protein
MKLVNSSAELLAEIRRNGTRQTIYFGHSLGPGGLRPGGLDKPGPTEQELRSAFQKGAPRPIFAGCFGAEVPGSNEAAPQGAIGSRRLIKWVDTETEITAHGMRARALQAQDIVMRRIVLEERGRYDAPDVPLQATPQMGNTVPP